MLSKQVLTQVTFESFECIALLRQKYVWILHVSSIVDYHHPPGEFLSIISRPSPSPGTGAGHVRTRACQSSCGRCNV